MSTGREDNLPPDPNIIRFEMSDMLNWQHPMAALIDADVIIDCAAQVSTFESVTDPWKDYKINSLGKFMLLETLRKHNDDALIIYTSSRSVHGETPLGDVTDELSPFKPHSFYNVHKIYIEHLLKLYRELYGMKNVILRPANVYGPRMTNKGLYGFVCRWIAYVLQDKPIPIWGSGYQIRDFTYVTDIAKAYPMVVDNPAALGQAFLLCNGVGTTLIDLANKISNICEKKLNLEFYPSKKGDIQRFVGDFDKARATLGWSPTVDLDEGLKLTIDWVKQNLSRYNEYNLV